MSRPPPGWVERVGWLLAIIDRAEAEIGVAALHGTPTLVAEQKRIVAYRQLDALMAQRPPLATRPRRPMVKATIQIPERARRMFAALEDQINVEATRQRALRTSNDNAASASPQQQGKQQHGINSRTNR